MDAVDVSEHYEVSTREDTPSLLTIVLDTNPRAWAAIGNVLPLSRAIANILVFVNAHLAFSNANQVALIAAHVDRAQWLYPTPPKPTRDASGDVSMKDAAPAQTSSANKFPQFAQIEAAVLDSVRKLMDQTTEADLAATTTQLSGALTLALCHINKAAQALCSPTANLEDSHKATTTAPPTVRGRILVISVSDSEPSQYIPTMNAVFAAAHAQVAIDTLSLTGDPTFLQQACFNTGGTYLAATHPQGLLTYLMFGLIADTEAREALVAPTHDTVDFRAACFCHGRVVDTGFVCSICLSIFCELPENSECLTCGTKLSLGNYGAKPAVVPRKKKKKRRIVNGGSREETGSATGTPRP
ncbi:RNA polymerase II transcription factor B subunit 4 [Fusarium falciforme]|uniref:General transcription and DNA repair factor IIH subunit TFB4 n=1 Tax=Fusarium falciforme TaxID=195108 RepID=A0A9W8R9C1_9HYPO|nr:General transcription and DNA repair factor IIH subunit TFB4 [Fusarium falciforme]KAJ4142628.1 RNA polymerase II transcription factor B subunit 4 [Fusarium falciforme]KAJ4190841.1 RNA polymerase II transcription factor B subunit 4 [Fusarium falciforme]KAJ4202106.1 RNA polymerase II transcription factor B subunit 4 [Fusarium falciforme]KAJ4257119.1 RNA polymerase II transcription factor B subunit 4 [Fusarium falciforme]WAO89168.1 General transcription and DNA repair factor IIH subunit TFB4 [